MAKKKATEFEGLVDGTRKRVEARMKAMTDAMIEADIPMDATTELALVVLGMAARKRLVDHLVGDET